jgi:hypothetical protein
MRQMTLRHSKPPVEQTRSAASSEHADRPHVLDLRPGEPVRVRSASEIFKTLDERGTLEGLPFMPEMVKYCGRVSSVGKRADKTCGDSSWGLRRMTNTVHLSGIRCDGAAHGGCQAACLIYWKEAWLERIEPGSAEDPGAPQTASEGAFVTGTLLPAARNGNAPSDHEPAWRCQATEIPRASVRLHGWQLGQYRRDARNWGTRKVLRVLIVDAFNRFQHLNRRYLPRLLLFKAGQPYPFIDGTLEKGRTPSAELGLRPGDLVRIKPKEEIIKTLDRTNKNRGLSFDIEMVKYCGHTARVRGRVERLIDERTGQMIHIKSDCIILEGVVCTADYHRLCPRSIYSYWRELWLEKVPSPPTISARDGTGRARPKENRTPWIP